VGPAVLPSAQIRLGIASVGPHLLGSHVGALASAAVGGRRQFVASHRASAGQSESVLQTPRAGHVLVRLNERPRFAQPDPGVGIARIDLGRAAEAGPRRERIARQRRRPSFLDKLLYFGGG